MVGAVTDSRVYPVLIYRDQRRVFYLPIRAIEGVIAPGKSVEVALIGLPFNTKPSSGPPRHNPVWRRGTVVEPWEHSFGSVVCVELEAE